MPNKMAMEVGMTDVFLQYVSKFKKRLQEPQTGGRRAQKEPSLLALNSYT